MEKQKKHIRTLISAFLAASAFVCIAPITQAQSVISKEAMEKAVAFSEKIKTEKLLTENIASLEALNLENLPPKVRLRHIRQHAHGRIAHSNSFDRDKILTLYKSTLEETGAQRDRDVFKLHRRLLENIDLLDPNLDRAKLVDYLENATNDKDWFVASNAWLLLGVVNSFANNPSLALQETQEAFKKIPNEISPYVTDAHILTLTSTTYLNNLLLNTELAIENTSDLIARKQAAGYPIDGTSLLNNLLYSLSMWREHEVSTQISQFVLDIEKEVGSNTPGLTELRVARLYDQQSNYEAALKHINDGLKVVQIPSVKKHLHFLEVNSLIGLGRVSEAKEKITALENVPESEKSNDIFQAYINKTKLGFAIQENDKSKVYKYTNELLDLTTQNLLKTYSTRTSKLVASLENTKERQAEREANLTREADLQRAKAEQSKRVNQLLLVLLAILSLAASLAIVFARYRYNISKKLAIKTAEAEDADRMKSEFLGMVSHELRTPLNGIVGIADLLSTQAPTPDMRHKAGIVLDSSNKLTHVIESIVDMSSIDGEKMQLYPEPTNIWSLVKRLERDWRSKIEVNGVTFTCFVEDSLDREITIDKMRMEQCLKNLLSNAAKFTERGRVHLHVTGKALEGGIAEVTAIVADTGQGMSEAVQDKLFTPFVQADSTMTRKYGGSGLGLAITRSLARMMDGDVTMISAEGRGSEFTLTIRGPQSESVQHDLQEETAPEQPIGMPEQNVSVIENSYFAAEARNDSDIPITRAAAAEVNRLKGLKVLIVEDEPANQEVIKLFIDPQGCKTLCTGNGIEALNVLNTQAIDIILMDIRMPQMDGIETTKAIRESEREYSETPIIALTADVSAENNAECMAAGVDIFLTKPIKSHDLIEAMQYVLLMQGQGNDHAARVA